VLRVIGHLGSGTEREQAAMIAVLVGGGRAEAVLKSAASRFRVLPLDQLQASDLVTNQDTGLFPRTRPADLGDCHAFVSHSWQDDGHAKYLALGEWAPSVTVCAGNRVSIWLDKAWCASWRCVIIALHAMRWCTWWVCDQPTILYPKLKVSSLLRPQHRPERH